MEMKMYIIEEIQKRVITGSYFTKDELCRLYEDLTYLTSISYEAATKRIIQNMEDSVKNIYHSGCINGISTSVYTSFHSILMCMGKSIYKEKITQDTVFDIASITKLFTTILTLQLSDRGILSLSENITDILPNYSNLQHYTILDLLKMSGELRTPYRIENAKTKKEAEACLEKTYLYNTDKKHSKYSDVGMMILPFVICKKVEEKLGMHLSYEEILKLFLLEPYHFIYTGYHKKEKIAGSGRTDLRVHDPKARKLGGTTGSAGLFSNNYDFSILARNLFEEKILSKKTLSKLYIDYTKKGRGMGGLYQKHPDITKTYVPRFYSEKSFASEGFTGSVVLYDLSNKIYNGFLVDAIKEGKTIKDISFRDCFNILQEEISYNTFLLDCLDKVQAKQKIYSRK